VTSPGYRLIVFDWDGTLADSIGRIVSCFHACFQRHELPSPPEAAIKGSIGLPLRDACRELMPAIEEDFLDRFIADYGEIWRDPALPLPSLFSGALELLEWLDARGYRLAIATGKSRVGLTRELAWHGLTERFDPIRCAGEAEPKPHPDMLRQAMAAAEVEPADTLMIGDTAMDLAMARAAGVDAVAVLTGGHGREQLQPLGPRALLPHAPALRPWLESATAARAS